MSGPATWHRSINGVAVPVRLGARTWRVRSRWASRAELRAEDPMALDRARTDTAALAVVPLAIEGPTLGVLGFAFAEPAAQCRPHEREIVWHIDFDRSRSGHGGHHLQVTSHQFGRRAPVEPGLEDTAFEP